VSRKTVVAAIAVVTVVGGGAVVAASPASSSEGFVTRLVDGDTLDVLVDGRTERVRLLNIDTPETKHPDKAVQCLGPEAADLLAELAPPGARIRLEYDEEREDRYGRTLAAAFTADGRLINAEVARAGLGRAVVYGENDRFLPQVQAAQREAADDGRGLYSSDVTCTLPGRLQQVTEAVESAEAAGTAAVGSSSAELSSAASQAAIAAAAAVAANEAFQLPRRGLIWAAYSAVDQERFAASMASLATRATGARSRLERAAITARAAEAEAARIAAERAAKAKAKAEREARARARAKAAAERAAAEAAAQAAAERARAARPAAPAQRPRAEAPKKSAPRVTRPRPKPVTKPNPYPGYTGPRCYAPGGKTWKPCS
jgi:micrococcal nuclease